MMGQNLGVLLRKEPLVTLALWAFLSFVCVCVCVLGTVNDITFLITSNNYMADEVSTTLYMVIRSDLKFLLIQGLTMRVI